MGALEDGAATFNAKSLKDIRYAHAWGFFHFLVILPELLGTSQDYQTELTSLLKSARTVSQDGWPSSSELDELNKLIHDVNLWALNMVDENSINCEYN